MILCAAGDPGGSRAVQPVALELIRRGVPVRIVEHGFLGREWPCSHSIALVSPDAAEQFLTECAAFVFGSSTTDTFPLSLARYAKALGKPVIHVLDNWSSYRHRLQTDGGPLLEPDIYAVMDEAAKTGALAEGIPESCLIVAGHPAFGEIAEELRALPSCDRQAAAERLGLPVDKVRLAFVCEPFSQVFGKDVCAKNHPGFTEEIVLPAFAAALASYKKHVHVAVLPHPKQTVDEVSDVWEWSRGALTGRVVSLPRGRDILPALDGIAGMASILLYEAWLGGLPVLSLQPGCRFDALRRFALLEEVAYTAILEMIPATTAAWLMRCRSDEKEGARPELALHRAAPFTIANKVMQLTGTGRK